MWIVNVGEDKGEVWLAVAQHVSEARFAVFCWIFGHENIHYILRVKAQGLQHMQFMECV